MIYGIGTRFRHLNTYNIYTLCWVKFREFCFIDFNTAHGLGSGIIIGESNGLLETQTPRILLPRFEVGNVVAINGFEYQINREHRSLVLRSQNGSLYRTDSDFVYEYDLIPQLDLAMFMKPGDKITGLYTTWSDE